MTQPRTELNTAYSEAGAEPIPWSDVDAILAEAKMFWLATVRADGRPHVTPLPAVWDDGVLHLCTGDEEQKSVNLRRNPNVVLTTGANWMHDGVDLVVEGVAERVTGRDRLVVLAGLWKSKLDWDFQIGEDSLHDGAGHNGLVYGVRLVKVLAFGKGPYTQTRYRFAAG